MVERNGKAMPTGKQQFKEFHEGYFAVLTVNEDGIYKGAWAGPFKIEGNKYIETYKYGSDTKWIDWYGEQEWSMKGDTLIMIGHKKVFDPKGKEFPGTT